MNEQIGFKFDATGSPVTAARQKMLAEAESGEITECPCCYRTVKIYQRLINAQMAFCLIVLAREYRKEQRYFHVSEIANAAVGGDFAKLALWDLIEQMENDDPTKKTSGFWKPTMAGRRFLMGQPVAKYANVLFGDVVGYSMDQATISDALNANFDYSELMEWTPAT